MKASHRVQRLKLVLRREQILGTRPHDLVLELRIDLGRFDGDRRRDGIGEITSGLAYPAHVAGHRRQRREQIEARNRGCELFGDLLDQEVPERDAPQTGLTVGDRVEDCRFVVGHEVVGRDRSIEEGLDRAGQVEGERHFDEDKRLVGRQRVEEAETTAVVFEPPAQVVPPSYLVDRLVGDELLQNRSRCVPVDPLEPQEASVEPRAQNVR